MNGEQTTKTLCLTWTRNTEMANLQTSRVWPTLGMATFITSVEHNSNKLLWFNGNLSIGMNRTVKGSTIYVKVTNKYSTTRDLRQTVTQHFVLVYLETNRIHFWNTTSQPITQYPKISVGSVKFLLEAATSKKKCCKATRTSATRTSADFMWLYARFSNTLFSTLNSSFKYCYMYSTCR